MTTDPILDVLHETRRKLLADAGGTLEGLVAELQKRQRDSGRQIIKSRTREPHTEAYRSIPKLLYLGWRFAYPRLR